MKKSELTQFTQIIEILVKREIKKQLPQVIAETFKKMMGTSQQCIVEQSTEHIEKGGDLPLNEENEGEEINLRQSLKEIFSGTPLMKPKEIPTNPKHYTKNPILNQILNETTGDLRAREGMTGMAAFQGGYNPSVFSSEPMTNNTQIVDENKGLPSIPLSSLPSGISVLDVAKQVPLDKEVKYALTKNYSELMKRIDQKRGKKV
jgi:hypothetical protein